MPLLHIALFPVIGGCYLLRMVTPGSKRVDLAAAVIASHPEIDLVLAVLALGGVVGRHLRIRAAVEQLFRGQQILRFRLYDDGGLGARAGGDWYKAQ